jgi:hypothetical protein
MTTNFDIASYLKDTIYEARTTLGLRNDAILFGDVDRIHVTPMVCVDSGSKERELNAAPRRTLVTGTTYILVYHSAVKQATANREDDDQFAEQLEALIHQDSVFGGLCHFSLVRSVEFGYQIRNNTVYRASRLTVEAQWNEMLP